MSAEPSEQGEGNMWPVAIDEGNPDHIGSIAWQRRKQMAAYTRYLRTGRYISYSPGAEVRRMYRHFRYYEAVRASRRTSNPEHEIDPTLLIALELYTALQYLTHTRRQVFEACVIGRIRLPNLITHRWEWQWNGPPLTAAQCGQMLDLKAQNVLNVIGRATDTLVARIYTPFPSE